MDESEPRASELLAWSTDVPLDPPTVRLAAVPATLSTTGALAGTVMQAFWFDVGGKPVDQFAFVDHVPPAGFVQLSSLVGVADATW
jgi:hypothetical protein